MCIAALTLIENEIDMLIGDIESLNIEIETSLKYIDNRKYDIVNIVNRKEELERAVLILKGDKIE